MHRRSRLFRRHKHRRDRSEGRDGLYSDRLRGRADPVQLGLVANLNRPGGTSRCDANQRGDKRQSGYRYCIESLPAARVLALLVNPANEASSRNNGRVRFWQPPDLRYSSCTYSMPMFRATSRRPSQRPLNCGPADGGQRVVPRPIRNLAARCFRQRIADHLQFKRFTAAGRPDRSYGSEITEAYAWPAPIPVVPQGRQAASICCGTATKVKFIINLRTAKALGHCPATLIGRADEA